MSAEAEATDILIRMMMEGGQYCLKITGSAAAKGLALAFAGTKLAYERAHGHQKLGGKISARAFLTAFAESDVYALSTDDLKKLKPELKRLHIPYMEYKRTHEQRENNSVDVAIGRVHGEQFQRLCEKLGIGTPEKWDFAAEEIPDEAYEEALADTQGQIIDFVVGPDGVAMRPGQNPTFAPPETSERSEQESEKSETPEKPPKEQDIDAPPPTSVDDVFVDGAPLAENVKRASFLSKVRSGELVPISAAQKLVTETDEKYLRITVPGTKGRERMKVPIDDVLSMPPNTANVMIALRADKEYEIEVLRGARGEYRMHTETGAQIRDGGKWNIGYGTAAHRRSNTAKQTTEKAETPTSVKEPQIEEVKGRGK